MTGPTDDAGVAERPGEPRRATDGGEETAVAGARSSRSAGAALDSLGGEAVGVTLEGVRKEYGSIVAVDGIDLSIEPGELFVLLGPSGCGKTTTLRMVAGLETPTGGTIRIGDRDVTNTLPQNRDISMVFQSYALYPHKTVRENLDFPLAKLSLTDEERTRRIERAAAMLEIDDILEKTPGQLSGGQRQRVAVGRTVVRDPSVFLMDEPLSNLDAKLRVQTRGELRRLQYDLGTTTLYVTHDQEEAMSLASRMAIMNGGAIEQVGTPEEIYEHPVNAFVAGFLGEPAITFVDVDPGAETVAALGDVPLSAFRGRLPPTTAQIGVRPEDGILVDEDGLVAEDGGDDSRDADGGDSGDGGTPARVAPGVGAASEPIPFAVDFVEPLGNAYEVTGHTGPTEWRLHAEELPEGVVEGVETRLVVDLDAMHCFDATGAAIDRDGTPDDGAATGANDTDGAPDGASGGPEADGGDA